MAVLQALRNGIAGLLDKLGVVTSLPTALAALAASRGAFTAEQQEVALHELASLLRSRQQRSRIRASLSVREREVLALIAQGLSTKQMATRLGISPRTVESHISRTYRKLSVRTRVQAVTRAAQAGIADLRPRSRRENEELAATRATKDSPRQVSTGRPAHKASLAVLWALTGSVSRKRSARPSRAR